MVIYTYSGNKTGGCQAFNCFVSMSCKRAEEGTCCNIDISQYNKLRNGILRCCYCPCLCLIGRWIETNNKEFDCPPHSLSYKYTVVVLVVVRWRNKPGSMTDWMTDGPKQPNRPTSFLRQIVMVADLLRSRRAVVDYVWCLVVCSSKRYNEVDPNWALVRELFAVISFRFPFLFFLHGGGGGGM